MAGITEVPAYVRVANDQEMLEMALVENIQRADLNALEIAISYQRLMEECNLTHEALSDRVGKDRSTVTNYVRLLKLPAQIQSSIKNGAISMGHARALAGIDNLALQLKIYKEVIDQELSVRALEQVIKSYNANVSGKSIKQTETYSAEIKKIKDEISHALGSKVDIKRNHAGKGSITISFSSDDQLNSIVDFLRKDN